MSFPQVPIQLDSTCHIARLAGYQGAHRAISSPGFPVISQLRGPKNVFGHVSHCELEPGIFLTMLFPGSARVLVQELTRAKIIVWCGDLGRDSNGCEDI